MKSISIDNLYYQLDKHILLAQAYTEINDLFFIIRACRLKPYIFLQDKNTKLILHRHWVDEFGNSLHITNNKKLKLRYNDLSIDRDHIISTDLYYGLSLDKITKISKSAYLLVGEDEDLNETCAIVTFLGIDNYFRTYLYLYGEWQPISPLILGIKHLSVLVRGREFHYFKESSIKEKTPLPCRAPSQWLTSVPVNKALQTMLDKKYPGIFTFLKHKE